MIVQNAIIQLKSTQGVPMLYIILILIAAATVIIRATFKLRRIKVRFAAETLEVHKQAKAMSTE